MDNDQKQIPRIEIEYLNNEHYMIKITYFLIKNSQIIIFEKLQIIHTSFKLYYHDKNC
jgi:hypothetical protein